MIGVKVVRASLSSLNDIFANCSLVRSIVDPYWKLRIIIELSAYCALLLAVGRSLTQEANVSNNYLRALARSWSALKCKSEQSTTSGSVFITSLGMALRTEEEIAFVPSWIDVQKLLAIA